MKTRYFLLSLLIFTIVSQLGCSDFDKKTIRVGSNVWPGYETLHLAKHLGHIPHNIKLIELMSATDVMEAFRLGRLEIAALTLDEAMTLVSEGINLKIFLVMDVSHGGDMVISRSTISDLSELKGKTIAYEQTALGALMLHEAMQAGGLNIDDLKLVHLKIHQQIEAFNDGSIDAVITFEPVATKLLQFDSNVIFDSSNIPNMIVDVLVARDNTLKEHSQLIKILVNGQFEALQAINEKRYESLEVMSQRMGISIEDLNTAMAGIHYPSMQENQQLLARGGTLNKTIKRLNRILHEASIIPKPIDAKALIDDTYVKP
ncbi:ABC transporter substrate-binding protein [Pseudoalteromonas sp. Of7M-16]|uniref:ABC transporter substrate-binding protein n=1 Tax=Pseudoalteromonas sp. Of7M-16 TaxID=2917756 RepID=UPI001EF44F9D|nr:ABC transporter substrate-binding protein [Pseudoalteromonas sp. Of7M-16]MCG7550801.1 ABC transporter substrate-binding protein [Pseudoalteromonas sp. Of7M-16]